MTEPAEMVSRICLDRIRAAEQIIDPVFLRSPQYNCEALSDRLGCEVTLKVELVNPVRCFKGRGAELLASNLPTGEPVVCASAGNFGQAMAYACRRRQIPLVVFSATTVNPLKAGRIRQLGAELILCGEDFDYAKSEARVYAAQQGWRFVEDAADIETAEGAGTIALELLSMPSPPDVWLIPVGNGGLINGMGHVAKALRPETRIIGIQAAGAPAMVESWRLGRIVRHSRIDTIADGIGVRVPIPEAFADMQPILDDALLVSDDQILSAMRVLLVHVGVLAEPSAAVGVAALLAFPDQFRGRRVATILCGGNVTREQMQAWFQIAH